MSNRNETSLTLPSDREILITRVFDAPRRLVFEAWTKPKHLLRWWGLRSSTMTVCEIDLRVGGKWRYVTRAANGQDFAFSGEYRDITPPERLVYTEEYEAMPGHSHIITVTFSEENGKTTLTSHSLYLNAEDRNGHIQSGLEYGTRESYMRLDDYLAEEKPIRELTLTRVFNAPRELVFKMWIDGKHLAKWWGPKNHTNPVCEVDARPGGAIRIEMVGPDGIAIPSKGVFREIVAPERVVFTNAALEDTDGNPQIETVNTVTLTEQGDKTQMTLHVAVIKASPAISGSLAGINQGWNESLDRLEMALKSG